MIKIDTFEITHLDSIEKVEKISNINPLVNYYFEPIVSKFNNSSSGLKIEVGFPMYYFPKSVADSFRFITFLKVRGKLDGDHVAPDEMATALAPLYKKAIEEGQRKMSDLFAREIGVPFKETPYVELEFAKKLVLESFERFQKG